MKQNTKDWIQYSSAIAMIASAIILAFGAFIVTSNIASGVLIYIAQALCYAAGIFGVSVYFRTKLGEFESSTKKQMEAMMKQILGENKG